MNKEILETYTMTPEEEIKWLRQCLRDLQQENNQLTGKLERIKHYINFWYERFNELGDNAMASEYKCILNKIKELEEGVK